jgi:hypothetical protein
MSSVVGDRIPMRQTNLIKASGTWEVFQLAHGPGGPLASQPEMGRVVSIGSAPARVLT